MTRKNDYDVLTKDIVEGLREARDFLDGKPTKGSAVIRYRGHCVDILAIRTALGMTRNEFAKAFHFTTRSLQNWERGFRKPNAHTLAYLQLIAANPKRAYKALHG